MSFKYFNVKNGLTTGNISLHSANANVQANYFLGNISVTSSANLGAVANVKITGGTSGYVLQTDGTGNLSWVAQSGGSGISSISNGNSNVNIPSANGNVNISAVGNANVVVITGTGLNVTGNANISGNLTAGNINAGSGSGGSISGANSVTANYFIGSGNNLSNIQGANVSGQVSNATVAGTVYTNAQPNITSVGSLTGLTVSNATGVVNFTTTANVTLGAVANLHISGGTSSQYLQTDGAGNLSWSTVSTGAASNISNGNSNVNIPVANGNVNISAVGNANILVVTGTGANISGYFDVTGNIKTGNANLGNAATANYFIGSGNNLSNIQGANVTGAVGLATYATTANSVAGANVSGQVANALVAGTVYTNAQPNITSVGTLTSLTISGNANTGNLGTTNLIATGTGSFGANVNMNTYWINNVGYPSLSTDAATKSYVDTMISSGIAYHQPVLVATTTTLATATGGTTSYNSPNGAANGIGSYISTTGTFNLIDTANVQTIGTRILVKDEANAAWNGVYTYANTTAIIRATDADTYGPDSTTDLSINDFFFTSGGSVNKGTSFVVSAPTGTITFGTSNITFSVFTTSQVYDAGTGLTLTGTTFSVNASQTQITSVGSLTGLTVNGNANISGNLSAGNISAGSGSGGSISGANSITANFFIGSGNNLSNIQAANVSGQVSNALVAGTVYTNAQPNITSVGSLTGLTVSNATGVVNFTTTANVTLGSVSNLHISGGSSSQYLQTDGAGNLSWVTISTGSSIISNGNSNVNIPAANGNVNISAVGNANVVVVTGTGANISGTLNVTGNATVGNLITSGSGGNITNVNVISANTFTASGNITAGNANLGNLTTSNYFHGVFDNTSSSQPNITSVGTLTSLGVNGTITAVNFTANTGVFTGNGNGLSSIVGANVTGAVAYATTANSVAGANVSGQVSNALVSGTVYTNAQPNITSVGSLTGLTVSNATGIVNFTTTANVTLGAVANLHISGGSSSQYLQTDGAGNLSWSTVSVSSASISNGNSNVNIPAANGNVNITAVGNTTAVITGTGANIFGTLTTTGNVTFTGANVSLGNVGNVKITGGTANYVLKTDGAGNLDWVAQTAGTAANVTVDNFTGNGVQTVFTLSTTPIGINQTSVNYNGATVLRTDYSLTGANITFSSAPANGSLIEVTTINLTSGGGGGITAQDLLSPFLLMGA